MITYFRILSLDLTSQQLKCMNKMREAVRIESQQSNSPDKKDMHNSVSARHLFSSSIPKSDDTEVQVTKIIEANISKIQKDFKVCLDEIHELRRELLSSSPSNKILSQNAVLKHQIPSRKREVFFEVIIMIILHSIQLK